MKYTIFIIIMVVCIVVIIAWLIYSRISKKKADYEEEIVSTGRHVAPLERTITSVCWLSDDDKLLYKLSIEDEDVLLTKYSQSQYLKENPDEDKISPVLWERMIDLVKQSISSNEDEQYIMRKGKYAKKSDGKILVKWSDSREDILLSDIDEIEDLFIKISEQKD